jgi:hypothetical protein
MLFKTLEGQLMKERWMACDVDGNGAGVDA